MPAPQPTVVIVDDAAEIRALVKLRLRLADVFDVVGEGANGEEAIALAERHRPTLLLLDVSMPYLDGLQALPKVLEVSPETRVVMFSGFDENGLAQRALQLGATAFLEKSIPIDTLADTLAALVGVQPATDGESDTAELPGEPAGDSDQRALDEHLERFREVFEQAAIGMATVTLSGNVVRANRALGDLFGRDPHDLVGAAYADLVVGDSGELRQAIARIADNGDDVVRVDNDIPVGPETRRVRTTFAAVRDSDRRPLYVFLQVQDVSAEQQLRRSEQRFRLLVEAVQDYAIFMLDPQGHIVSWNAGAQRTKGYTEAEIVGQHFRVFYPPEKQAEGHPERELELALRDGRYEEQGWRVRKDGSRFWADVVITALYDDHGGHVGFGKVTRDVTRAHLAEEELRQSEQRFRLLVEAVQDYAIFMLDREGRVVSWNAGAQRTKGYTEAEIVGRHFRVFYPPARQAERHPEHLLEVALRDGRCEEEGWRVRKDGTQFWASVVITALFDDTRRHVGFGKVTRDMTERRQMVTELEHVNAQLRQARDDQAQFLAVTAHELRLPVGVLGGSAETLSRHWSELDEVDRAEILDGMSGSAVRLRRLFNDLLTASRLDADAIEMHQAPVLVADVLTAAAASARRRADAADVVVDVPHDLTVNADRDRLAQAVDNLVSNALQHGAGPVRVTAAVHPGSGTAQIRVADGGGGVPEGMRERLFDRFATGTSSGGTGLGLFIVRELAKAHGGDAFYDPPTADEPAGAFVLTLPHASKAP